MQKWIMCPRTHGPSWGNSPPPSLSTGVSVDEWVGDELPPTESQVQPGYILSMQMAFGMEQRRRNERGMREHIGRKY
jgi:hypothetical protein